MASDTLVRFDTNFGAFTVELYDAIAPITVANFLSYVNGGSYNGTFFHRLVSSFVLQGGGYADASGSVSTIPAKAPIPNEYQASDPDVAGTIAMAKLGGDPNSATSQFFFNLVDNSTSLGPSNNGGFTVFGRVSQGWNVVQTIAALRIVNAGAPLDQLPVTNSTGPVTISNLVQLQDVVVSGYSVSGPLTDLGTLASKDVVIAGAGATVQIEGLSGANAASGFQFGDTIDLVGTLGATLAGNTVTTATGTLTLSDAPSGYAYKLYGDAHGGTDVLLNPTSPAVDAIRYTDPVTSASGTASGDDYGDGPVDYLQRQYLYSGTDGVAIAAQVPNTFLKGGPNGDALQVTAGNNVLDGGGGSNFLIGGTGSDGGRDTFFVDERGGVITWSTIVNFHPGDQATIFGFHPGTSTLPYTASDGAAGYTGVTIHSEIDGPGKGVTGSMTFAGIDQATAQQHFAITTGTLPGDIDYLLIQYV